MMIDNADLTLLSRDDVLSLEPQLRVRWFRQLIIQHREMKRASQQLEDLLTMTGDASNIIGLVGMTGAGKSLLTQALLRGADLLFPRASPSEINILAVEAPASGERAWSMKPLFRRLLLAADEPLVGRQRPMQIVDGHLQPVRSSTRFSVDEFRICVERLLEHRNTKVVLIEESLHFLRLNKNDVVMDMLKSLSNVSGAKILLVGPHDIADMLYDYDQTSRRSDIVHFRRYLWTNDMDQKAFMAAIALFMKEWPCKSIPPVLGANFNLTKACCGAIGVAKESLSRLAWLQMSAKNEEIDLNTAWRKVLRPPAARMKIEAAAVAGERLVKGKCYDDESVDWIDGVDDAAA